MEARTRRAAGKPPGTAACPDVMAGPPASSLPVPSWTAPVTKAAGLAAVVLAVTGTLAVEAAGAGFRLWPDSACVREIGSGYQGVSGICSVVGAARSLPETTVLAVAIFAGALSAAAGMLAFRRMGTRRGRSQAIAGAALGVQAVAVAGILLWFRSGDLVVFARNFLDFSVLSGNAGALLDGMRNTLVLAFGGETGGLVIGLAACFLTQAGERAVRVPAYLYINFFRGTPVIWQLSIFYFGLALGFRVSISTYETAILVFALNTGAYSAEVFRAGIESIGRGQVQAARGLGMSAAQAMRHVILPQAVRQVIPPLMNAFVALIKETALIIALGLSQGQLDLFNWALQGYSNSYNATYFVLAAAGYLIVTLPLIYLTGIAERRLRSGHASVA